MRSWVERSAGSSTWKYTFNTWESTLGAQNLWEMVQKLHLAFRTYSWLWTWSRTIAPWEKVIRGSSESRLPGISGPYHLYNKDFGRHRLTSRSSFFEFPAICKWGDVIYPHLYVLWLPEGSQHSSCDQALA